MRSILHIVNAAAKMAIVISIAIISGCVKDFETITHNNIDSEGSVAQLMNVKFGEDIVNMIDSEANEVLFPTGDARLDAVLMDLGATKITRVFPFAGKHEALQIAEGLNLWYTIWGIKVDTRSTISVLNSDIINSFEPVYRPKLGEYKVTQIDETATRTSSQTRFNDPHFGFQWNLYNDGTRGNNPSAGIVSSIAGADVNILPAWELTTGSPNVIVAVVDGGIDVNHPDLIDNLWVNSAEIPNNGIDDDNNGYVDDYYGFNFVLNSSDVTGHDHGTHVAGVIAAKNDNGIGISSIAGGDSTPNSGVRLMSCQIFAKNPDYDPSDPFSDDTIGCSVDMTAAAIVYGANNGALISQNSWGYELGVATPKIVKEAISYFQKYAGTSSIDIYKSNPSPMNGGVFVVAAGNDGYFWEAAPAGEPDVISVASLAPDYAAAYYSNYGDWITISAPGGSIPYGGKYILENGLYTSCILSTVVSGFGSGYGYMQGTSMACPHVSAIAALALSLHGGESFTNRDLISRVVSSAKAVNINDYNNSKYHNKLGVGAIDAMLAITSYDESVVPETPYFISEKMEVGYNTINVAFGADSGDEPLYKFVIYISENPIDDSNFSGENVDSFTISAMGYEPGSVMNLALSGLKTSTKYYLAVKSFVRNGNSSPLILYDPYVETIKNSAPTISANIDLTEKIILSGAQKKIVSFVVNDEEGHEWGYALNYDNLSSISRDGESLILTIDASKMPAGIWRYELIVKDIYGASVSESFDVEVVANDPPKWIGNIAPISIKQRSTLDIDLKEYVTDEVPEELSFSASGYDQTQILTTISDGVISLTPQQRGSFKVLLTATDSVEQSITQEISIFSFENEAINAIFRGVTSNQLYVKIGDAIDGAFVVKIRDIMGRNMLSKSYNTNSLDPIKRTFLIDLSTIVNGHYELEIVCGGNSYRENFLKM